MTDIHDLALRIERDGIGSVEREIADIAADALSSGVRPVSAAVAADPREPQPARVRALALLIAAGVTGRPVPAGTRHAVTLAA